MYIHFEKTETCVDLRKPNSVQIENSVPLEKQHYFHCFTIFFTEILHKC